MPMSEMRQQEQKPLLSGIPSSSSTNSNHNSAKSTQHLGDHSPIDFSPRPNQSNHPRTSSLTSYFSANVEVGGNRRSMSQDYGSLPSSRRMRDDNNHHAGSTMNGAGLSRSVELPSLVNKISPTTDEFSDEVSAKLNPNAAMMMGGSGSDKTGSQRVNRHFHGSSHYNNLVPSHAVSSGGSKMVKSGRQRKKIAARSKGGEFQARRKKRRLYFCCISSEIDIEKLADHFLVEIKEDGDSNKDRNTANNLSLAVNPSPAKPSSSSGGGDSNEGSKDKEGIRVKFPHIQGRMYDEVLYLYTDVSQNSPHMQPDEHDKEVMVSNSNRKVHYSSHDETAKEGTDCETDQPVTSTSTAFVAGIVATPSIDADEGRAAKPAAIQSREQAVFPKLLPPTGFRSPSFIPSLPTVNLGKGYQSATSGHTSSDGYSSSDGFLQHSSKIPLPPLRNPAKQDTSMYPIEEFSDLDPTPVNSPYSEQSKTPGGRSIYQTDDEEYEFTPPPLSASKMDRQVSDSEYEGADTLLLNQHSDGEMTDTGMDLLLMSQERLRHLRSADHRRGSIDKTEEAMKEFQSSSQFWHLGGKEVFIFDFGAIVFWGYHRDEVKELLHEFRQFIVKGRLSEIEFEAGEDDMAFVTTEEAESITIANDVILLPDRTTVQMRLAVSFAIAQSSILSIFEARIEEKIEEYKYIPETLALCGKVKLSQKELGAMIGEVFVIRHDVNLHSEILDIPDYFWKEQAIEPLYRMTMMYLEIEPRTEVVNKRLDLLRELLRLLQHQHENDHAVKLEWIVIWLIVVSVVLEVMVIVGKLFNFNIE